MHLKSERSKEESVALRLHLLPYAYKNVSSLHLPHNMITCLYVCVCLGNIRLYILSHMEVICLLGSPLAKLVIML